MTLFSNKTPRTALRILGAILITLIVASLTRTAMWGGPFLVYKVRQPSIRSQCAAVHAGMSLKDVEDMIHSGAWPLQESLDGNQFVFANWEACQVDLDHETKIVKTAHVVSIGMQ